MTSHLHNALRSGRFVVTCELSPPKGTDLEPLLAKVRLLASRVDAFNLTDSHAARMAMCPLAAAVRVREAGGEPVLQITTRDRNRIALQSDLLGAAALGIENVVFMGGDPPANGDHPEAKSVFDVYSSQILAAASALTRGRDMAGNPLSGTPDLYLGAVVNPGSADLDDELKRMEEKLEAGARFFQSQAVYDPASFERFMTAARRFDAPVLAGVLVLRSAKTARYLNERVPGIHVPEPLIAELESAPDPGVAGRAIAARTIRALCGLSAGVHVMAMGRESELPEMLDDAGVTPATRERAPAGSG